MAVRSSLWRTQRCKESHATSAMDETYGDQLNGRSRKIATKLLSKDMQGGITKWLVSTGMPKWKHFALKGVTPSAVVQPESGRLPNAATSIIESCMYGKSLNQTSRGRSKLEDDGLGAAQEYGRQSSATIRSDWRSVANIGDVCLLDLETKLCLKLKAGPWQMFLVFHRMIASSQLVHSQARSSYPIGILLCEDQDVEYAS